MKRATLGMLGALPALWTWRHHRSLAVRVWRQSTLPVTATEPLFVRSAGDGDRAFVLLHGLISTGQIFGQTFDRLGQHGRIVVPDLAGFGKSLQEGRSSFTADDHLDALDSLAEQHGLFTKRWTVGAHSMGSSLALRWALRHPDHIHKIVCWGAPTYQSPDKTRSSVSGSPMARLFALDTPVAEQACAISCHHRHAAGLLTAALEPRLPTVITRAAALHTWPAYRDAMQHLVIETPWQQLLDDIAGHGIPTMLMWGDADRVGDPNFARRLTVTHTNTTVTVLPGANHHLPITHPEICLEHVTGSSDTSPSRAVLPEVARQSGTEDARA